VTLQTPTVLEHGMTDPVLDAVMKLRTIPKVEENFEKDEEDLF
jgi:hypothetical protein